MDSIIYTSLPNPGSHGIHTGGLANKSGIEAVMDFYTYMSLMGRGFQVRAGTVTTPSVGDVAITDTAAEMATDATSGLLILPVYANISIRLATGTLHEYAIKSVGTVSSAGTAFVPLPLRTATATGSADVALTTARAQGAGAVTVTAELATTTRRHWGTANPVAAGAGNDVPAYEWTPRMPPSLGGPQCFYVQIAATTTGPSYFCTVEYLELPTATFV